MNPSSSPTVADIRRSLHLLRSPDSRARMHAVHVLEYVIDDPRVTRLFEYLCRRDPDPRVRRAAWQAIAQDRPAVPAPGPLDRAIERAKALPRKGTGAVFLLDPGNRHLLARATRHRARRRRNARRLFILAAILLAIALALGVYIAPAMRDWYRLNRSGIAVEGTITALETDGDTWRMAYRFATAHNPDAVPQVNTQRLTCAAYQRLAVGQPVTVTYWPPDPALAATTQPDPAHLLRDGLAIAAAALLPGAGLLAGLGIALARSGDRVQQQRMVPGRIVACNGRRDADGDFKLRVRYRFTSPATGRAIVAQAARLRNDLRGADLPEPGAPVAVCYRDDRAFRLL